MDQFELVDGLKNKDDAAFRELVKNYQKPIRNVCLGIVLQLEIAEEITQDVFVEVFNSIHSFRAESKLSTWMYRMAVNKSLNYLRSQKKHRLLQRLESFFSEESENRQIQIADSSIPNPLQRIIATEEAERIQNIIHKLPENQRIAFSLHKFDDLPYKEISEVMNLSLSSVESLIHRAKVNLQKSILK